MPKPLSTGSSTAPAPPPIAWREAWRFWLKLGLVGFGGPAGQIAIMHAELVERRRWISEKRFLHALNYCMLLPGPEAQQLATYIGWLMHRTWGGIVAGTLFILPSLLLLVGLSWLYIAHGDTPLLAGLFYGIKPAVVAVVLHAAHRMGRRVLLGPGSWALAVAAFAAMASAQVPFPAVLGMAALTGLLLRHRIPAAAPAPQARAPVQPAVIDDDTPVPEHARFASGRLWRVLLTGLLLWALPMGVLLAWGGVRHILSQMGLFFTQAALLTFGGAYAVLPYVHQAAVEHHGWLSSAQMLDGLALGESTPGPLIMVVAFVGFVGGYLRQFLGPEHLFAAGALAACVVTWFTFLPSFIFILAGGPLVESSRKTLALAAPLAAMTAAVVGVILHLAVLLGQHVVWPGGLAQAADAVAALILGGAVLALWRWKWPVVQVIAASALLGLLAQTLARIG